MNKFETELKAGNFVTSECTYCNKIVWPPSDYCDICFKDVNWRKVSESGTIVELSRMGKLDTKFNTAKPGNTVKLTKCSFDDKNGFFFSLENKQ